MALPGRDCIPDADAGTYVRRHSRGAAVTHNYLDMLHHYKCSPSPQCNFAASTNSKTAMKIVNLITLLLALLLSVMHYKGVA